MKPLHICYISQEYPPETGWGGIGSYTYEMAHGLVRAGHRVTVITRAIDREKTVGDDGVQVHRILPAPDWSRLRGLWRLNRIWPGFAWAAMLRLRAIHAHSPVDVVEAGEGRADSFFVAWLSKRPKIVVRLHTARIFVDRFNAVPSEKSRKSEYWLEKQAILRADALTAPTRAVVDLTNTWLSLQSSRMWVVPNPVNTKTFTPSEGRKEMEVLYVGRLERLKGVQTLIEALPCILRQRSVVTFRFMGSDGIDADGLSWRERILEAIPMCERARLHFEHVSRNALVHYYRRAAMCVSPSIWENCPYSLLEAMACGTPVVATLAGGVPELVEDGVSGLLVPTEDAPSLSNAICELLEDRERREEMGRNARRRVEELFSAVHLIPKMLQVYQSVLDER